ncbi:MAG: META domain-containing protein [Cyclonatronaceae bacterium]
MIPKKCPIVILAVVSIFTAGLFASCDLMQTDSRGVADPDRLAGVTWELTKTIYTDGSTWTVPENEFYTITLTDQFTTGGRAACNSCGGEYALSGPDSISIMWFCTEAMCAETERYKHHISHTTRYETPGSEMRLKFTGDDRYPSGVMFFNAENGNEFYSND